MSLYAAFPNTYTTVNNYTFPWQITRIENGIEIKYLGVEEPSGFNDKQLAEIQQYGICQPLKADEFNKWQYDGSVALAFMQLPMKTLLGLNAMVMTKFNSLDDFVLWLGNELNNLPDK